MSMHAFKSLCVVAAKEAFYVNGKAKAKWAFLGAHFAPFWRWKNMFFNDDAILLKKRGIKNDFLFFEDGE